MPRRRPTSPRPAGATATALAARLWLLALLLAGASPRGAAKKRQACAAPAPGAPQLWRFSVVAEFPHDPTAFTQGLVFGTRCYSDSDECKEVFYESTGARGKWGGAACSPGWLADWLLGRSGLWASGAAVETAACPRRNTHHSPTRI